MRLPELQSEPLPLGTPLRAQLSELGIPVARIGGATGRTSKQYKSRGVYSRTNGGKRVYSARPGVRLWNGSVLADYVGLKLQLS